MNHPIQQNHLRLPQSYLIATLSLALATLVGCGKAPSDQAESSDNASQDDTIMAGFIGLNHSHDAPDETCFICDPAKREPGRLWCKEHGRYEDRCWACHPDIEDPDRLFCREHALYEDECHICHPEIAKPDSTTKTTTLTTANETTEMSAAAGEQKSAEGGLYCKEHDVKERECGICQPGLASSLQPGESLKVRFASDQSAEKAGIRVGSPQAAEVTPSVSVYCQTEYNLNALAKITPLVDGIVKRVHKDLGETVEAGEPLVEIHASVVAEAKSAYLSALVRLDTAQQTLKRQEKLDAENIAAEKDLIEARGAFRSMRFTSETARQKLMNLGMSAEAVTRVEATQDTSASLTLRAPFRGTLVSRHAVVGETVELGHELYTLANLESFWLELSIPPKALDRIVMGQPVEAHFEELGDQPVIGRITWIDSAVDPETRMVRARAVVRPDGHRVSVGLYGKANIAISERQNGVVVPSSAVQRHEDNDFVFVRDSSDLYSLRRVEISARRNNQAEIVRGLTPGESVVVDGSFIAMSEFLKSRLGAGCVH
jgi:cobalt-zinc-cadmium efflux system membrane fusion protein